MARKQEDGGNRGQGDRKGTPDAGGATSPSHCCYQSCQGDRKGTPLQYTNATALAYIVGAYPCVRPGNSGNSNVTATLHRLRLAYPCGRLVPDYRHLPVFVPLRYFLPFEIMVLHIRVI